MADVTIVLDPKINPENKEEVLRVFEEEVERFSKFMDGLTQSSAGGPLLPQERVLLKTYLVHKHRGRIDVAS
jgi:hypothetical protein